MMYQVSFIIPNNDDNVETVNIIIMEIKFLYNQVIYFFFQTKLN